MTCRLVLVMKHSSQHDMLVIGSGLSRRGMPSAAARATMMSRVTPESTRCAGGVNKTSSTTANRLLFEPSVKWPSRYSKASWTPAAARGPLRQVADERVERLRLWKITTAFKGDRRSAQRVVGRRIHRRRLWPDVRDSLPTILGSHDEKSQGTHRRTVRGKGLSDPALKCHQVGRQWQVQDLGRVCQASQMGHFLKRDASYDLHRFIDTKGAVKRRGEHRDARL